MAAQPLSPDKELLALGWERDAETDRYRLGSIDWLSRNEARVLSNTAWPPIEHLAVETDEPSVTALLSDILAELKAIKAKLGSIGGVVQ
jgi:hypothetical protein